MAKHIKEADIGSIDPSEFRSFLLYKTDSASAVPLQAFDGGTAPPHSNIPEQLFIEVDRPDIAGSATRVRDALKARADELGVQIRF